jgi:hypothetical protein
MGHNVKWKNVDWDGRSKRKNVNDDKMLNWKKHRMETTLTKFIFGLRLYIY